MTPQTDLFVTVLAIIMCAVIGLISFRKHFAEHNDVKPRMVPWMIISLGMIATGFMLFVHLVNIFGFETGRG